uniref:Uncharacterized protein n=1 Tax=Panagrellus redivivus TaxID=6233 RepID=A0A7E4UU87_PANRE
MKKWERKWKTKQTKDAIWSNNKVTDKNPPKNNSSSIARRKGSARRLVKRASFSPSLAELPLGCLFEGEERGGEGKTEPSWWQVAAVDDEERHARRPRKLQTHVGRRGTQGRRSPWQLGRVVACARTGPWGAAGDGRLPLGRGWLAVTDSSLRRGAEARAARHRRGADACAEMTAAVSQPSGLARSFYSWGARNRDETCVSRQRRAINGAKCEGLYIKQSDQLGDPRTTNMKPHSGGQYT